jgi:hypothetical protein
MISALIIATTLAATNVSQGVIRICRQPGSKGGDRGSIPIPAGTDFTEPAAAKGKPPNHAFVIETDAAGNLPPSPGCVDVAAHMKTGTIGYIVGPDYPQSMTSKFSGAGVQLEARALSPMQVFVIIP